MIVTEEEAKRKTCHKTLVDPRPFQEQVPHPCLGSQCMAWRSATPMLGALLQIIPIATQATKPEGEGWTYDTGITHWMQYEQTEVGYCGLAGKPEVSE